MTVAAPIIIEGAVGGVLVGDVPPERISESLGFADGGRSGEVYLVNGEGQLVTLPPKARRGLGIGDLGRAHGDRGRAPGEERGERGSRV